MSKCPLCGSLVEPADEYCTTCGGRLSASAAQPVAAMQNQVQDYAPDDWQSPLPNGMSMSGISDPNGYAYSAPPVVGQTPAPRKSGKTLAIVASVAAAIAVILAVGVVMANPGSPNSGSSNPSGASSESGVVASDGEKASMSDYSWGELSKIADEISAASSKSDALGIAANYHLVEGDKISDSAVKSVKLVDGTKVSIRLVDVYQDDKAGGKGKAGLTFLFGDCVAMRTMNSWESNDGGWAECEMRSWLNSSFIDQLPDDLKSGIVKVNKSTNNAGVTGSKNSITATEDKLWLPSVRELCGDVDVIGDKDQATNDRLNAIMNKEGKQYQWFADKGVECKKSKHLARALDGVEELWWLRTPSPGRSDLFRAVGEDGSPSKYGIADIAHGVVPGFCL